MLRTLTVLALILTAAPAQAQEVSRLFQIDAGPPVPLAGSAPPDSARVGDSFLLPLTVRNLTRRAVTLRRVVFQLPPSIELVNPDIDGVDNDRDGQVDEGDEGFSRSEDGTVAWRIPETAPLVEPGGTVERAVTLRLSPTAVPGSAPALVLRAAASAGDVTLRTERSVGFSLAPPTLSLTLDGASGSLAVAASDSPVLRAVIALPGGRIEGLGLDLSGSAAVAGFEGVEAQAGPAVICTGDPAVETDAAELRVGFGTCTADATAPTADRMLTVTARTALEDADPFAGADDIALHRRLTLSAGMTGTMPVQAPLSFSGSLTGPLSGARLLSMTETPVDAGDEVEARWQLVNRGDAPARGLRLRAGAGSAFPCGMIAPVEGPGDACAGGLALEPIAPGAERDITLRARLAGDAALNTQTALRLTLHGDDTPEAALPPAFPVLRLPPAPVLSVDTDSEWDAGGAVITARIGDVGALEFAGALPEGRYRGALVLRARAVDAATGQPLDPAPLSVESFGAEATGDARFDASGDPVTRAEDGWSVTRLPLYRVVVPVAEEGPAPSGYAGRVQLVFRDDDAIQADRVIEIAAQAELFGQSTDPEQSLIEVLVIEPSLDLTLRSTDANRILDLHESTHVAVLTCNRGSAGAQSILLKLRLPPGITLDDRRPATLSGLDAERIGDDAAVFAAGAGALGETYFDTATGILRGELDPGHVLDPEQCLVMAAYIRRSEEFRAEGSSATLVASVDPFTGRDGPAARVYPAVGGGEIRFSLPDLHFGPDSSVAVGGERLIVHTVALEIPVAAGPHRITLSTRSSAGLDWTILREDTGGGRIPWRDGTMVPGGEVVRLRMEAPTPPTRPLGWIDTTVVDALALPDTGSPLTASARLVTRRKVSPGGLIEVTKSMALDRDCDGALDDERGQDALFEPVKDAAPGDCVIFRVAFRHGGDKSMERIVVRDHIPEGTALRPGALEVLRMPEPLDDSDVTTPDAESRDLVWSFVGLFEPGAEGEVSYSVRLLE